MGIFDVFRCRRYMYTPEQISQVQGYIENQFGDAKLVLHERAPSRLHIDVLVIPPTKEHNYIRLVTMGMGAYKMNVPREAQGMELERCELMISLPPDWKYDSIKKQERWPLEHLRSMARLPMWTKSWLCYGHTASDGRNDPPYADNTKLCSMLVLSQTDRLGNDMWMNVAGLGRVNFYQLMPVYKEELSMLRQQKYEELTSRWIAENILPVVDIHRKNCGIE